MGEQWVSFSIADEQYVHSTNEIREVIPYMAPKPVPGSPEYVEGILNVRGQVVTVLGSRRLLGQSVATDVSDDRIMILELGEELIGICIDAVGDIVSFSTDDVNWSDTQSDSRIIKGTVLLDATLFIVTDFAGYCREISEEL